MHSGDEPHYLVILHSLLRDGDLDLADDYASVHGGGDEAGRAFRGTALAHHTAWYAGDVCVRWFDVYESEAPAWRRGADGRPVPTPRPDVPLGPGPEREYSCHWPGLAFLIAPAAFPFRHGGLAEPVALLCSWAATVAALIAFVALARATGATARGAAVAAILTFLGTPLWHYGRALFTESFATACAVAAYLAFAAHRRVVLAGLLCGVALMLKTTYVVFALPIAATLSVRRDVAGLARFSVGPAAAVLATLWLNDVQFGGPLRGPQPFAWGPVAAGAAGLLASADHGLLTFAPVVVCAVAGWVRLARRSPGALLLTAPAAGMFLVTACYLNWDGGYCFGPRYLVPVLPFLTLGIAHRASLEGGSPWRRADLLVVGAVSVAINALGALAYQKFWSTHPFAAFLG